MPKTLKGTGKPNIRKAIELTRDLEVGDVPVDHLAADLLRLEPLDVPDGLRRLAHRCPDRVGDAGLAAADDLAEPVHVLAHDDSSC